MKFRALLFAGLCDLFDQFVRVLMGVRGVFMRLSGEFVSSYMISFSESSGGGSVGVSCKVVEFCGSIMRTLWHGVLLIS
jgi:hypothetical protein